MARNQYLSNVYLYGANEDKGYPIDTVTVTVQAGMKSGSVLEVVGGKGVWVVAANAANAVYVLADELADTEDGLAAGDHTLKVVARAAGVGRNYLNYADVLDAGQLATVETALLAVGIKVETQY